MLFFYMGTVVFCVLLILLAHYAPRRRFFLVSVLVLAAIGGLTYTLWPAHEEKPTISAAELEQHEQQQQIFAGWYADYQKDLGELDRNWTQYHHILEDFKEDNISIQTTYLRLNQLEEESRRTQEHIAQHNPPLALNNECYDQLAVVVRRTNDYAAAQHRAIALTRAAADPATLRSNDQEEQSRLLQMVMIRESPAGLFTAPEISRIRELLATPKMQEES